MVSCPSPRAGRSSDGEATSRSAARLSAGCIAAWTQCTDTWTNKRANLDALAGWRGGYQNPGTLTCGVAGEQRTIHPIPRRLCQGCTKRQMVVPQSGAGKSPRRGVSRASWSSRSTAEPRWLCRHSPIHTQIGVSKASRHLEVLPQPRN